jgi:putative intracellular protease/amidase
MLLIGGIIIEPYEYISRAKNIITSTGPSTAIDVAFTLLEMLTGKENVKAVKHYKTRISNNPCS